MIYWILLFNVMAFICRPCYAEPDYLEYVGKVRGHFGVKLEDKSDAGGRLFAGGDIDDIGLSAKVCAEKDGFPDKNTSFGVEAQEAFLEDKRYSQATQAAGLYIYSRMDERTRFSTEFRYSQPYIYHLRDTADAAIKRFQGKNKVTTLLLRCENSPVDNAGYPSKGRKTDLSFEVSSESLGSDFNFLRTKAENAFYWTPRRWAFAKPPLDGLTFVLIQKGGWMKNLAGDEETPFFERFYAGGTAALRGYKPRYIAPSDSEGLPIGGNSIAVLTAEMRYPVYKDIKGAVFYDQGNAWKKSDDFDLADTKASVGWGLRWLTPLGVARLDYGYGLNGNSRQRNGRLHASLGIKF